MIKELKTRFGAWKVAERTLNDAPCAWAADDIEGKLIGFIEAQTADDGTDLFLLCESENADSALALVKTQDYIITYGDLS